MTLIGFVISTETKAWLQERARQEKRSMSNFLNVLIEERRVAEEGGLAEKQAEYGKILKAPPSRPIS